MTFSITAQLLSKAIDESGLTDREVADRAGIELTSTITMVKQGLTRLPLVYIPDLARTLGIDQKRFLIVAIEEYHGFIYGVLSDTLGLTVEDAQEGLVVMFRMASLKRNPEADAAFRKTLKGLLDLTDMIK